MAHKSIPTETISLTIGKAEALVLFELLADFHRQPTLEIRDDAERISLLRLHAALQSTMVEPFSTEYDRIISSARANLLRQSGTVEGSRPPTTNQ